MQVAIQLVAKIYIRHEKIKSQDKISTLDMRVLKIYNWLTNFIKINRSIIIMKHILNNSLLKFCDYERNSKQLYIKVLQFQSFYLKSPSSDYPSIYPVFYPL